LKAKPSEGIVASCIWGTKDPEKCKLLINRYFEKEKDKEEMIL